MDVVKKEIRIFSLLFVSAILSQIFTFLEKILLSRYLGPEKFGLFSLGLTIVNLVLFFLYLGIPTGIVRFSSIYLTNKEFGKLNGLMLFSKRFSLSVGFFASFLVILFSPRISSFYNNENLSFVLQIMSFSIMFLLFSDFVSSIYMGIFDARFKAYYRNIGFNLLKLSFFFIAALFSLSIYHICIFYLLAALGLFIVALVKIPRLYPVTPIYETKKWLVYSFPVLLASIFNLLMGKMDTILLGKFGNIKEVGFYSVAFSLAIALRIPINITSEAYFAPASSLLGKKDYNQLKKLFINTSYVTLIVTSPIFLASIFFTNYLIKILFGNAYLPSINIFVALAIGQMLFVFFGVFGPTLSALGETRFSFYTSLLASILNFVLDILLIRMMGGVGAAIATSISLIINSIINILFLYSKYKLLPFSKDYLKPILLTLTGIVLYFIFWETKIFFYGSFLLLEFLLIKLNLTFFIKYRKKLGDAIPILKNIPFFR